MGLPGKRPALGIVMRLVGYRRTRGSKLPSCAPADSGLESGRERRERLPRGRGGIDARNHDPVSYTHLTL
ncbi:MAG: hypothetical protein QUU85_06870, partial [Candidatus Eisenbacteria bacterium]|nr:hypothetical protein [Candidatus Eisenbacteria bacterium]